MRLSVLFSDALNAIKRNKKRSILTMLGIIIGIGAVIAIISIGKGFENFVTGQLTSDDSNKLSTVIQFMPNDTELYNDENLEFFNSSDIRNIEKIPGVEEVKLMTGTTAGDDTYIDMHNDENNYSSSTKLVDFSNQNIIEGRNLNSIDNETSSRVVIISEAAAMKLFPNSESYVGNNVSINGLFYTVVGIFQSTEMNMVANYEAYISNNTYMKYMQGNERSNAVTVFLQDGSNLTDISNNVVDSLKENGSLRNLGEYSFVDLGEMMDSISNVLGSITLFIALIGGISLFIAGIGMMNMMFISVSERTKEIGIRRALGATKKNITTQFLLEGIVLTVIGGILGYLFGLVLALIISNFLPFPAAIEAGPVLIALLISFTIGIVFSYSPAKSAANKNVIEILT